jgi:hypothetical protein
LFAPMFPDHLWPLCLHGRWTFEGLSDKIE